MSITKKERVYYIITTLKRLQNRIFYCSEPTSVSSEYLMVLGNYNKGIPVHITRRVAWSFFQVRTSTYDLET